MSTAIITANVIDAETDPSASSSYISKAISAGLPKFDPKVALATKPTPGASPVLSQVASPISTDPNVVRMEPFRVRANTMMDQLHADLMAQEANARTDAMVRKMGIGVKAAKAGPGEFYAVTVFYIPIQIGYLIRF